LACGETASRTSAATDPFYRDIVVVSAVATFSPEIPGIRFKLVGAAPVRIKTLAYAAESLTLLLW